MTRAGAIVALRGELARASFRPRVVLLALAELGPAVDGYGVDLTDVARRAVEEVSRAARLGTSVERAAAEYRADRAIDALLRAVLGL